MRRAPQGLTLLEMMIALAIVAVLTTLALPSFASMMSRHRLKAAAEMMSMDLAELRQLHAQQRRHRVCAAAALQLRLERRPGDRGQHAGHGQHHAQLHQREAQGAPMRQARHRLQPRASTRWRCCVWSM